MKRVMVALVSVFGLLTVQPVGVQNTVAAASAAGWAVPPLNTPIVGPCSGRTVDYRRDDFRTTPVPPPSCAEQLALQDEARSSATTAAPTQTGGPEILTAVETRKPGNYVADGRKMTLYTLVAADGGNLRYGPVPAGGVQRQALPCTGECLEAWVPLTAAADLGEGLDPALDADLVGTTELEDGTAQVTYNGFPLFYFSGDTAPGSKKGLGLESFGGR